MVTLDLHVEELVLELPDALGELEAQQLVREALALVAERLRRAPPRHPRRWEHLALEGLPPGVLREGRGAQALADALHTRLMEQSR